MEWGEAIAEARRYRGLSQPALLEKMGKTAESAQGLRSRVSEHERGRKMPHVSTLLEYVDALNIQLCYRPDTGWSWRPL